MKLGLNTSAWGCWMGDACRGSQRSGWEMFGLALVKLVMISMCEGAGFVGGPIYPIIFASGAMGSALGATNWVALLGGQYVYICTAAAMATALAALLHTQAGSKVQDWKDQR